MGRETTRNKILEHAGRIVRQKGFNNTGIQEILESAGVPKGSFYFYFKSKDELGLALIDYYAESLTLLRDSLLENATGSPLERLRKFFVGMRLFFSQEEWQSGCPIGNLTQEMGYLSDAFRSRLRAVFNFMQSTIRDYLEQAISCGELEPGLDANEVAHFIVDSWEGALLRMKAEGNIQPLILFERVTFGRVLNR